MLVNYLRNERAPARILAKRNDRRAHKIRRILGYGQVNSTAHGPCGGVFEGGIVHANGVNGFVSAGTKLILFYMQIYQNDSNDKTTKCHAWNNACMSRVEQCLYTRIVPRDFPIAKIKNVS